MPRRKIGCCPNCDNPLTLDEVDDLRFCEECGWTELPDGPGFTDYDNGPTGHGDICYSDADPGL